MKRITFILNVVTHARHVRVNGDWWTNGTDGLTSFQTTPRSTMGVLTTGTSTDGPTIIFQQYSNEGKYLSVILKLRW